MPSEAKEIVVSPLTSSAHAGVLAMKLPRLTGQPSEAGSTLAVELDALTELTEPARELATSAVVPPGTNAIPAGPCPTPPLAVPNTASVAALITETVLSNELLTTTRVESSLTATPIAWPPTGIVEVTVSVAVSITETEPVPLFAT